MLKSVLHLLAASMLVLAMPQWAAAQANTTRLVVFGDSLSDPGNLFALTQTNNVPPSYDMDAILPQALVPNAAYAVGGHHLSNGSTWIEDLAQSRALAQNAGPAWRDASSLATNYAVAGARAHDDPSAPIPSLSIQVGRFLHDVGNQAPDTALYVIAIGGNDVRDVLLLQDPNIIGLSLQKIAENIGALYQAGARKFLVLNAPNIGLLPSVHVLGIPNLWGLNGIADQTTQQFNFYLANVFLPPLRGYPGIQIVEFNLYGALNDLYVSHASYGLTEVNVPCVTPDVAPYKCTNPDEYLFWDGIHPTKTVHAILAQQVAHALQ
jgi:phospholipase/lecithinase/hemolysin